MMFQDAAALMRMVTGTCRNGIYEALPSSTTRSFQRSLAFPLNTVGANMDKLAPLMALDRTVSDAIKYGRQKKRPVGDQLFVTDGNGKAIRYSLWLGENETFWAHCPGVDWSLRAANSR